MKVQINFWNNKPALEYEAKDLREAVLMAIKEGADLRYADLSSADLSSADLRSADLSSANLSSADLRYADLSSADLSSADLSSAKNKEYVEATTIIHPTEGSFIGWKKCQNDVIVKLQIPAEAKRSCSTGRKCRAEFIKVLEVYGAEVGLSKHDKGETKYIKGQIVKCHSWDENRWEECSGGIHFFMTRYEAEQY